MLEIEVRVPDGVSAVPEVVERICMLEGLTLAHKGTLAKYPGCIHWHFRKGTQRGTLELTWWEREKRLWFKVSAGRSAVWIDQILEPLREQIEQALRNVG